MNEDAFAIVPRGAVVADGMGGHAAGDEASRIVVDAFVDALGQMPADATPDAVTAAIRAGVAEAMRACASFIEAHPRAAGMGSTLAACWIGHGTIVTAHMGDSRVYILRTNRTASVTRDHSRVMELVTSGELTREEARVHPRANVITRCIGAGVAEMEPRVRASPVVPGDRVVIVTDGCTDPVEEAAFCRTARFASSPDEAAAAVEAAALAGGGRDNITVVVVDIE